MSGVSELSTIGAPNSMDRVVIGELERRDPDALRSSVSRYGVMILEHPDRCGVSGEISICLKLGDAAE